MANLRKKMKSTIEKLLCDLDEEKNEAELRDIISILECCTSSKKYEYTTCYPEDKRRVFELLEHHGHTADLKRVGRRLVLTLDSGAYLWCQRNLKMLEAGWLYLIYSEPVGCYKIGRTENTLRRRLSDYRKAEKWVVVHQAFCKKHLRAQEVKLRIFCLAKYEIAKGDEYFLVEKDEVCIIIRYIDNLCL